MKKFLISIFVLLVFAIPAQAGIDNALVHNIERITTTMTSFGEVKNPNLDNRNSVITISLKLGEMREAVHSGLSIDVDRNGGFLIYLKALGQFKKGIKDAEHGLRDKKKKYFVEAVEHFEKGREYFQELIEMVESQRSVYNE